MKVSYRYIRDKCNVPLPLRLFSTQKARSTVRMFDCTRSERNWGADSFDLLNTKNSLNKSVSMWLIDLG